MEFDFQPTLSSSLVSLEPLKEEHYRPLFRIASDPLIWKQHPVPERYREKLFRPFFEESISSGGALVVMDARNKQIIGSSRYAAYSAERSEVEIGWSFLARTHWGGIYNGEMKRLMIAHAFRFVRTVVFLVGPENIRSQRAVEKIGGVRAGLRKDGGGRESITYKINRH